MRITQIAPLPNAFRRAAMAARNASFPISPTSLFGRGTTSPCSPAATRSQLRAVPGAPAALRLDARTLDPRSLSSGPARAGPDDRERGSRVRASSCSAAGAPGTSSAAVIQFAAGEQGDVVPLPNQLLGEIGNDAFRAAIAARRNAFGKRSDLSNPHSLFSCWSSSDLATLDGGVRGPRPGPAGGCARRLHEGPGSSAERRAAPATSCRRPIDERPQTPSIAPFRLRDALQRQQRRQVGAVEPRVRHRGERGLGVVGDAEAGGLDHVAVVRPCRRPPAPRPGRRVHRNGPARGCSRPGKMPKPLLN